MTLNNCNIGDKIMIKNMESDPKVKKRLQDMGLTNGSMLRMISNYSDDAYIVKIRGSKVVIGKDIAEKISVELLHGCGPCGCHGQGHHSHHHMMGKGFKRGFKENR
jgi:ferrous iron transport protein A